MSIVSSAPNPSKYDSRLLPVILSCLPFVLAALAVIFFVRFVKAYERTADALEDIARDVRKRGTDL